MSSALTYRSDYSDELAPMPGISEAWLLARRAIAAGERCAVWHRPGGPAWVALGAVATAARGHNLEAMSPAAWPPGVPRVWFGGAFDGTPGSGLWRGWPACEAWLPAALFRVDAAGVECVAGDACELWLKRVRDWPQPPPAVVAPRTIEALQRKALEARIAAAEVVCRAGELTKIVVAAREVWAPVREVDAPLLAATVPVLSATRFLLYRPGAGVLLGASPETLARVVDGRVETHALAGTIAAGAPLPPGDKLVREHEAVVAAIRAGLGRCCEAVACDPRPRRRTVGALDHLETPISGRLRPGMDIAAVVAALHPTPAVGGLPHGAALAWLRSYEGVERGWYAGPLGFDTAGGGEALVVLRSLLVRDGQAYAYAGAGIVAGSEPRAEVAEIAAKLTPAREALAALHGAAVPA